MRAANLAHTRPCPICEAEIALEENILSGELIQCCECGSELEVTITHNDMTLSVAPDIQEDWGE